MVEEVKMWFEERLRKSAVYLLVSFRNFSITAYFSDSPFSIAFLILSVLDSPFDETPALSYRAEDLKDRQFMKYYVRRGKGGGKSGDVCDAGS
ncbi:hypothetical protein OROGR_015025 [Orobanche gracilis]